LPGADDGTPHAGLTNGESRLGQELRKNTPAAFDIASVKRTL